MRSLATVTATRLVYEQTPEEFQFETHKAKAILEDVIGEGIGKQVGLSQRSGCTRSILHCSKITS